MTQWHKRLRVKVAHQLQQVRLFLTENGLAAVLKQMPAAPVPAIEPSHTAAQKLSQVIKLTGESGLNISGMGIYSCLLDALVGLALL